ncbi:glutamate racemase [Lentilitoribacter sp. EG35]|uniref:glutamate racemase n=1 Tax=Lentilitoribacter sp. EG35 TaxID=3234192 RepID=UPI0034613F23
MMNKQAPILLFDSGIGGLTVLREARILVPERQFIYVADDAAFPYGSWDETNLESHIVELMGKLIETYRPELIIIACNTASTLVMTALRSRFPEVKFVGTVPAIKPAAERTKSGVISVLATPGTVKRAYTRDLIQSFASQCHVRLVGSEDLAGLAEAYMSGGKVSDDALRPIIEQCLIELDGNHTDIVVLACTHYPFLANRFRQISPWPVDWLDPAEAIARHAISLIDRAQVSGQPDKDVALFTSSTVSFSKAQLIRGFGLELLV